MTERIAHICAELSPAPVFADVGCDHGMCALHMLSRGLCGRAYISDVSAASLSKAEALLMPYIAAGKCVPVVADGLDGIPEPCDLVLIAGMGGEEIVKILRRRPLPVRFVLQPMKNTEKVRAHLLERGARIERDYTFSEKKRCYDLLRGSGSGGDSYAPLELRYGRDNLREAPAAFRAKLAEEIGKLRVRLAGGAMKRESREALLAALYEREMIADAIEGTV